MIKAFTRIKHWHFDHVKGSISFTLLNRVPFRKFNRVKQDRKKNLKPEIVVVSGDIAKKGISSEYDLAKIFLDDLLIAMDLPPERLFVVPGNHDVNRKKYRKSGVP